MGRIPNLKRIVLEEFPAEHRKWLVSLIDPLNDFFKIMYQNFNRGITFEDNIQSQIKEISFYKTATVPSKSTPIQFKNTMPVKPIGVIVLKVQEDMSDPGVLSNAVSIDWTYSNNDIQIRNISGLTNGTSYKIKVLVIGG
jgi:hypothetical protein